MSLDNRAQDLLDQLREGRGKQNQINDELYRRMTTAETNIQKNHNNQVKLNNRINSMWLKIVGSAAVFAGIVTALVEAIKSAL